METFSDFVIFMTLLFSTAFLIGIIRPDFVVFWSTNKTRAKVATVFGGLAVACFVVWGITVSQRRDTIKSNSSPRDSTHFQQSQ